MMTNENGDVSGCYVMLTQDRVKPQTIIQQNVAIGTLAVDGWAVVFGTARMMLAQRHDVSK